MRPDPAWTELTAASKGFLLIAAMAILLLNLAESGVQELIYPGRTQGFLRLARAGPGIYRFFVAGVAHDVAPSSLLEATRRVFHGVLQGIR